MSNNFDEEYFENGLVTGKSCYINYRWMPELTIKMAYHIIKHLNLKEGTSVLDFGCAKGFVVKALRLLDADAYGCDISYYAIDNAEPDVRHYCKLIAPQTQNLIPYERKFDWIMSKDVLEHMTENDVDKLLEESYEKSDNMFHVIPLADEQGKFIIPEYELDVTHILKKDLNWWIEKFKSKKWKNVVYQYQVKGIKDNWTSKHKYGNVFFIVKK